MSLSDCKGNIVNITWIDFDHAHEHMALIVFGNRQLHREN